jgi:hypothetical protein
MPLNILNVLLFWTESQNILLRIFSQKQFSFSLVPKFVCVRIFLAKQTEKLFVLLFTFVNRSTSAKKNQCCGLWIRIDIRIVSGLNGVPVSKSGSES